MASQAKVDYGEVEAPQTMNKGPPNSNSTMFRGDRRYFIVEPYSSLDADIILVASDTSAPNWGESTGPPRAFKVHKERLRAASAVFTDMLDCGDEGSIKEGGELPYLQLTEPSAVIRALLGGVYPNEREKIVPLESLHWQLCKQVWEAAKKFELHMLSAYAGDILVAKMPEIDPEEALDLYNRAKLFKFEELADKCKRMLCNTPISKLSRDTISMISIELLMEISSARDERLYNAAKLVYESLSGQSLGTTSIATILKELEALFPEITGKKAANLGNPAADDPDSFSWQKNGTGGNWNSSSWAHDAPGHHL